MAKDRNTIAKRQREVEKKRKADAKRERRAEKRKRTEEPSDKDHIQQSVSPAEHEVLRIFRKSRMTPGEVLSFDSADLKTMSVFGSTNQQGIFN